MIGFVQLWTSLAELGVGERGVERAESSRCVCHACLRFRTNNGSCVACQEDGKGFFSTAASRDVVRRACARVRPTHEGGHEGCYRFTHAYTRVLRAVRKKSQ